MFDVFLSYRRESGTEFCSFIYESLTGDGYNVFFDFNSIRQGAFDTQIDDAIAECSFVLVMLAPNDLDRCLEDPEGDWVLHEIDVAMQCGKIVIPVAIRKGFSFPDDKGIPALQYLSRQELCDLSGPDASTRIRTTLHHFMTRSPYALSRDEYHKGLLTCDYQRWEEGTLREIYADFDFVQEFGRTFPVVVLEGSDSVSYPFRELNEPQNLLEIDNPIDYSDMPGVSDFRRIVGPNVHFPNLYGFTNNGIVLDGQRKVRGFRARPLTYKETVFSGHVMHYELWRAYCQVKGARKGTLSDLPIREAIHAGRESWDVLLSGCNRSALCDVCMAILAYDEIECDYDIAVATRSDKVACYPGYLSIIPSGGFELYELEERQNPLMIKKNFSIVAALYREYIEEIFGDEDFDSATGDDDLRRLYRNIHIKELRRGMGKTYFFEFLGVSFDVISLRPTFSFVLRIDDPDFLYENEIRKNQENVDIRFISLRDFEDAVMQSQDSSPLMAESAGVYRLLKSNHLFQEAMSANP